MRSDQRSTPQRLNALEGGAAVSILAGGESADALRALLGVGDFPDREKVKHVLNMAERVTDGEFDLTARLNRGARAVGRVVTLAQRAEPNALSRNTLLWAHQTVKRVTAPLFSPAELAAVIRGAGLQRLDLDRVRYHLLRDSDLLNERAVPHAWQRLDRADQAENAVVIRDPIQEVLRLERQDKVLSDINLRLGWVLLGQRTPRPRLTCERGSSSTGPMCWSSRGARRAFLGRWESHS